MKILKEYIRTLLEQEGALSKFKKLAEENQDIKTLMSFAMEEFDPIDAGSSRAVFSLGPDRVI